MCCSFLLYIFAVWYVPSLILIHYIDPLQSAIFTQMFLSLARTQSIIDLTCLSGLVFSISQKRRGICQNIMTESRGTSHFKILSLLVSLQEWPSITSPSLLQTEQPGAPASMLSSLRLLHKDSVGYETENRRLLLVCNYTWGNGATGWSELGPNALLSKRYSDNKGQKNEIV